MNLTIIGSGYVGLTTGTCFAEMGHHVICVDNNAEKIRTLQSGSIPIYEPKLEELVKKNVAVGRLEFSPSIADSIAESEVIFIAVPTPPNTDGSVDLTYIEKVAREIAQVLQPEMGYKVIVDKSTVPVKTGEKVRQTIKRYAGTDVQFDIVSNPEFLREGCAVDDLLHPDRIVIGANSERAMDVIKRVYQPIHAPILETDVNSAELIKHAANSFLALKISYINAVAKVCEKTGADVELVAEGIGMDKRISRHFLNAGLGYGGSCFPKDVKAFINISRTLGIPFTLLEEVEHINDTQHTHFLDQIRDRLWVLKDKKNSRLGPGLQAEHGRHPGIHRPQAVRKTPQGRSHRHCHGPQGHAHRRPHPGTHGRHAGGRHVRMRPGCGSADHRHGMERIRECGPAKAGGRHAQPHHL